MRSMDMSQPSADGDDPYPIYARPSSSSSWCGGRIPCEELQGTCRFADVFLGFDHGRAIGDTIPKLRGAAAER